MLIKGFGLRRINRSKKGLRQNESFVIEQAKRMCDHPLTKLMGTSLSPLPIRRLLALGLMTLTWVGLTGCDELFSGFQAGQEHLLLGNPSEAGVDPNNFLMIKPQYALSYNRDRATANWASWQLNQSWLGQTKRQDDFREDPALPPAWHQVDENDYRDSGYDRGHLVPSGDRTASRADNTATFVMTNIIPQTPENNREPWRELEEYCRSLVRQGKELYIVAGVYENREDIANGTVTAPRRTWKVVVVLDEEGQGLQGIDRDTRVIAVDVPNYLKVNHDWRTYRVSVDTLETLTGYDFLSNVSHRIQADIEANVDQL